MSLSFKTLHVFFILSFLSSSLRSAALPEENSSQDKIKLQNFLLEAQAERFFLESTAKNIKKNDCNVLGSTHFGIFTDNLRVLDLTSEDIAKLVLERYNFYTAILFFIEKNLEAYLKKPNAQAKKKLKKFGIELAYISRSEFFEIPRLIKNIGEEVSFQASLFFNSMYGKKNLDLTQDLNAIRSFFSFSNHFSKFTLNIKEAMNTLAPFIINQKGFGPVHGILKALKHTGLVYLNEDLFQGDIHMKCHFNRCVYFLSLEECLSSILCTNLAEETHKLYEAKNYTFLYMKFSELSVGSNVMGNMPEKACPLTKALPNEQLSIKFFRKQNLEKEKEKLYRQITLWLSKKENSASLNKKSFTLSSKNTNPKRLQKKVSKNYHQRKKNEKSQSKNKKKRKNKHQAPKLSNKKSISHSIKSQQEPIHANQNLASPNNSHQAHEHALPPTHTTSSKEQQKKDQTTHQEADKNTLYNHQSKKPSIDDEDEKEWEDIKENESTLAISSQQTTLDQYPDQVATAMGSLAKELVTGTTGPINTQLEKTPENPHKELDIDKFQTNYVDGTSFDTAQTRYSTKGENFYYRTMRVNKQSNKETDSCKRIHMKKFIKDVCGDLGKSPTGLKYLRVSNKKLGVETWVKIINLNKQTNEHMPYIYFKTHLPHDNSKEFPLNTLKSYIKPRLEEAGYADKNGHAYNYTSLIGMVITTLQLYSRK